MTERKKEHKIKKLIWVEIRHGKDLLKSISDYCLENDIKIAFITVIGALQRARFSYYNQKEKKYYQNLLEKPVEIISCLGNVSIKEGKPFVHIHISVSDEKGNVFGGHLEEGNIVFAAECAIFDLEGDLLERKFNKTTNLFLWDFS